MLKGIFFFLFNLIKDTQQFMKVQSINQTQMGLFTYKKNNILSSTTYLQVAVSDNKNRPTLCLYILSSRITRCNSHTTPKYKKLDQKWRGEYRYRYSKSFTTKYPTCHISEKVRGRGPWQEIKAFFCLYLNTIFW